MNNVLDDEEADNVTGVVGTQSQVWVPCTGLAPYCRRLHGFCQSLDYRGAMSVTAPSIELPILKSREVMVKRLFAKFGDLQPLNSGTLWREPVETPVRNPGIEASD